MLSVALTGNVAAGKSTVATLFQAWGAQLIDSDQLVREVQAPGTPVLLSIVRRFGAGVLRPDGALDRGQLRAIVLADPQALADLNALVHPAVRRRSQERLAQLRAEGARIVVTDIPLLYEAADPARFDAVVLVDAPVEVRRQRLFERSGLPAHEAERLMAAQLPSAHKRERAHYVIDNDADVATLERRAREVWNALEARASAA
ncbi:MAG: dephospho-CoA kinase [Gemmatimonadales bacterium]|jgi:dephospho-CoA kinase|nr:dephospho-CoA kinase [Gemmatimonadales bacterium]